MGRMQQKTKDRVERVRELLAKGMSVVEACKEAEIQPSFYYSAKKKLGDEGQLKRKKRSVRRHYEVVPIVDSRPSSHAFLVTGTPEQLAEFWNKAKGGSNA